MWFQMLSPMLFQMSCHKGGQQERIRPKAKAAPRLFQPGRKARACVHDVMWRGI